MSKSEIPLYAITGASGFIGARIAEILALTRTGRVRAIVRSYSRLARLSELPQGLLEYEVAEITDAKAMQRACQGVDVVIHCAFGNSGSAQQQFADTFYGTCNALAAARASEVARFVHFSTAAIHDFSGHALVEDSPLAAFENESYEHAKWLAECAVRESDINWVVLRPTVVYGPWGRDWTSTPLKRLREGIAALPDVACQGVSNAAYVDDVARCALLAARSMCRDTFLVTGAEDVSWGRFYNGFRGLVPSAQTGTVPLEAWEEQLYASCAQADSSRARVSLGYNPRVGWLEGLSRVALWAQWYGLA
jgi:nucleoside-diphosphate-sugar epimerase